MTDPLTGAPPPQSGQPGTQSPPPPPPPPAVPPPPPPMAQPMAPPPAQPTYVQPAPTYAPPPGTIAAPPAAAAPGISISLSQPEALVAGGAALIVLTDLIFGIFGPYVVPNVIWVAAAVALVLVLAHGRLPFVGGRRELLIALAALVAVVAGVRSLFVDLVNLTRVGGRTLDLAFILGMVGLYVGIGLLAWGAWTLWRRRAV